MTDHRASLGALGFTYRVRRLADRIVDAGRRFSETAGVPLEPNWHALLLYLDDHLPVAVTEAAAALRISHPAVIEMTRRMEARGLVTTASDPADGRRRVLALSAQGQLDEEELTVRVSRRLERGEGAARSYREPTAVVIRAAVEADRGAVLHIARELVRTADTYAYDPEIGDDELWAYWCPPERGDGFVAELDGAVVGTFVIRPNNPGPGAHVANASYAVRADVRGIGLGRQMGEASLELAAGLGYRGMQFNTVVSTNAVALHLWRSLGFRIVGTVPDGFRLPDGSTVSHYVMYRALP